MRKTIKQETLEEAAKKSAIEQFEAGNSSYILGFIECAKSEWQQQQNKNLYSEEEVYNIIDNAFHLYASSYRQEAKEWFNEHKKQ